MIHTRKNFLGITLSASELFLPLTQTYTAAQVETSEQTVQVTLLQLEEVSDLIMTPSFADYVSPFVSLSMSKNKKLLERNVNLGNKKTGRINDRKNQAGNNQL